MFSMHLYMQSPSYVFEHLVALLLIKKLFVAVTYMYQFWTGNVCGFCVCFFMSRALGSSSGLKPPKHGGLALP